MSGAALMGRPIWRLATRRGWRRTVRQVLEIASLERDRRERLGYARNERAFAVGSSTNGRRESGGEE